MAFNRLKQVLHFGNKEKKPGHSIKDKLNFLSKALMIPISILPIAGILLGVGSAIPQIAGDNPSQILTDFANIITLPGQIVFSSLPLIFSIAITITFTKESGLAGLCSVLGWLIMCAIQTAFLHQSGSGDSFNATFLWYHWSGAEEYQEFKGLFTANNIPGMQSLNVSILGGIVNGVIVAKIYNSTKYTRLPEWLGVFGGTKFVPIATIFCSIVVGMFFSITWPILGKGLFLIGLSLMKAPYGLNTFVFAFLNRSLQPIGLHHVLNNLSGWTAIGGTFDSSLKAIVYVDGSYYELVDKTGAAINWYQLIGETSGQQYYGDSGIQTKLFQYVGKDITLGNQLQIGSSAVVNGALTGTKMDLTYDMMFRGSQYNINTHELQHYTYNPGQYTSGYGTVFLGALPAVGFAMLYCAPKGEERKRVSAQIISSIVVCFFTGIDEPLFFTFLFVAPGLFWGFHAVVTGIMCAICTNLQLYVPAIGPHVWGNSFIDLFTLNLVPDLTGGGAHCWVPVVEAIIFAPLYFFVFTWAIKKFDLKTPGRGGHLISKNEFKQIQAEKEEEKTSKSVSSSKTTTNTKIPVSAKEMSTDENIEKIIIAYGGGENMKEIESCFSRLRIIVNDPKKVNKQMLMETGAKGIITPGPNSVQVVYGNVVDIIKNKIKDKLGR